MRPLPSLLFVVSSLAALPPPPGPAQPSVRPVVVCHAARAGGEARPLSVEGAALAEHLAHGDFEPIGGTCSLVPRVVGCGGVRCLRCPAGATCLVGSGDACEPPGSCAGVCVALAAARPSGACPRGLTRLDDPRDACEPGPGSECPTVCAEPLRLM